MPILLSSPVLPLINGPYTTCSLPLYSKLKLTFTASDLLDFSTDANLITASYMPDEPINELPLLAAFTSSLLILNSDICDPLL